MLRGGFAPSHEDDAPEDASAILLIGHAGPGFWRAFVPYTGEGDHPLDRWTRRVIDPIAAEVGAAALYPFGGPPFWPFQRWAKRAEPVHPSPLGILIHPDYGLWHAYRAALAFDRPVPLPVREERASPCETCLHEPCLHACPVEAFRAGYDVPRCRAHLASGQGETCFEAGCLARAACPVGRDYAYPSAQARFHVQAFLG